MNVRAFILKSALRERLVHDLGPFRAPAAGIVYASAYALKTSGLAPTAFRLLMRLHSAAFSRRIEERIVAQIREATARERNGEATGLSAAYAAAVDEAVSAFRASHNPDPRRLIGSRILVIKGGRPSERGVIVVDYSYVFPLMAGLFDLPAIADRYHIVLEPSWSGACAPEILLFTQFDRPVFIQSIEPRDDELFSALQNNLHVIPVAANWWVDHRTISPVPVSRRDIDVIMVSAWAGIKRHWRFFRALAKLRRRGHRLNVALVGYRYDLTKEDIYAQARYFSVADQVQLFERISQGEISGLLSRSKIHVLWSRRECANRAIIEAMLADVPVIVREGLTFGYRYPYINDQTGRYAEEHQLGDAILEMLDNGQAYRPRSWVLRHMTCQHATAVLEERVRSVAVSAGEPWTEGLAVKTSSLDSQHYWTPVDRGRFERDYRFLESAILRPANAQFH